VSKDRLQSFFTKSMEGNNLRTFQRDKVLTAQKQSSGVLFVIEAYGGPDKFKQVALWCDQCSGVAFTKEQIQICDNNLQSFYSHVTQDSKRSFATDLRRAKLDKNIYLSGTAEYKVRLTSGRVKCDSHGPGTRLRIDLFSK
jgi:hypothetical protein